MNIKKWNFDGDAIRVEYDSLPETSVYHPEATAGFSVVSRVVNEPGDPDNVHLEFDAKGHWAGNAKAIISSLRLYEKTDSQGGLYLEDDKIDFERRFGDIQGWILHKWVVRELPEKEHYDGEYRPVFKDELYWYKKGQPDDFKITNWTWVGLTLNFVL